MAEEKADNPDQIPDASLFPIMPVNGDAANTQQAHDGENDNPEIINQINAEPPLRIFDVNHREWGWAHTIALGSLVISIAFAIFTFINFNEYKRQFGVLNNPSLAIGHIEVPARIVGKKFEISYQILSLTRNAVHIYCSKYFFSFDTTEAKNIMKKIRSLPTINSNSYVMLEYPYPVSKILSENLSKKDSASFQDGFTTFLNEFEYYNTINKCWATYIIAARLKIGPPNRIIEVYYNENRDTVFNSTRPFPQ